MPSAPWRRSELDQSQVSLTHFRHPEVLGAKRRASKDDGPSASAASFEARGFTPLAPQDDGSHRNDENVMSLYY
jgi:hypothetical protein